MKYKIAFVSLSLTALLLSVSACNTTSMQPDQHSKVGFSNVTDIPLPVSAKMDMDKSLVSGSGDSWSGHLVYHTPKPQVSVIEFTNKEMISSGWSKISELRGPETIITFIKSKRIATFRVITEKSLMSKSTVVAIDMSNSNFRQGIVQEEEES